MSQVKLYLKEIEQLFNLRNQNNEEQMAKNHVKKTIPAGNKSPSNNQGVKPSATKGSTSGDNADTSAFKATGNTTKAKRK